jgi:hypothetical protein
VVSDVNGSRSATESLTILREEGKAVVSGVGFLFLTYLAVVVTFYVVAMASAAPDPQSERRRGRNRRMWMF